MENTDKERYIRQMTLKEIGQAGQEKIACAKVLVVGAGGLGSPALMYLAGTGIGKIGIMDADEVSITNIHRQIIHPADRVGMNKAESAKMTLEKINDQVEIVTYPYLLTEENARQIIGEYDFVIDAVDNFEAKFLISDTCVALKKAFCYGGVIEMHGQVLTYVPGEGPCVRCIFEEVPEPGTVPKCIDVGVLGPVCGIIGCIQATEAIKYITGAGELLTGRMMIVDGALMSTRIAKMSKPNPACPACGKA